MEIRPFTSDHLDECVELYCSVFSSPPWNEELKKERVRELLLTFLKDDNHIGFVAYDQSEIIGLVAGRYRPLSIPTFYLHEMCVKTDMQGKRVGSDIMKYLENELIQRKIEEIWLETKRISPAREFYEKQGFEERTQTVPMIKRLQK